MTLAFFKVYCDFGGLFFVISIIDHFDDEFFKFDLDVFFVKAGSLFFEGFFLGIVSCKHQVKVGLV